MSNVSSDSYDSERAVLAQKRAQLVLRSQVLHSIRCFFLAKGFLEVQTPIRTSAPAPEANIEPIALSDGWCLITSPELHMKRLLSAGYENLFQIVPVFRQGELGRLHHPEFTMLEWYRLDPDLRSIQDDCKELISAVCKSSGRDSGWEFQGVRLQPSGEWASMTVSQAFTRYASWDPVVQIDADKFDEDLVQKVEPHLGYPTPCFLTDYPAHQAALARISPYDPMVAERFELYWAGIEMANAFSELTDPTEQRKRFTAVMEQRRESGLPSYRLPEVFLKSLEHLRPCSGIALGVDRLVMLLANSRSIDEIVAFPPAMA